MENGLFFQKKKFTDKKFMSFKVSMMVKAWSNV